MTVIDRLDDDFAAIVGIPMSALDRASAAVLPGIRPTLLLLLGAASVAVATTVAALSLPAWLPTRPIGTASNSAPSTSSAPLAEAFIVEPIRPAPDSAVAISETGANDGTWANPAQSARQPQRLQNRLPSQKSALPEPIDQGSGESAQPSVEIASAARSRPFQRSYELNSENHELELSVSQTSELNSALKDAARTERVEAIDSIRLLRQK